MTTDEVKSDIETSTSPRFRERNANIAPAPPCTSPHHLLAVPLLAFAAGLYWEVRKGRTLGEGAQVGCAFWMLAQLLSIAGGFWLCKLFPDWFIPPV